MHDVSALWQQIYAQVDHRKEIAVTVNGVEYYEGRILNTAPSVSGKLFDAPSVGNARSRTLTLNLMPYDGPQGYISPLSEIRLYVRLKSADGQSVSEWIPKGVFYADEVKRDSDTGATRITAFDAIMKMERQYGNAVCRITFDDGFKGIQRFIKQIGDAMPTPLTPTHEGERFSAWYPNPADTQTVVRDMLFTAEWARKFTVTFDSGSGTPQTFSVFSGDATPTPTTPTKEGYTFMGWTPTPAATVTADALYFAQWEAVTLQSVTITAYPTKTSYFVGDTLDYTGLVVTASYSDSTTQDVTAECVLSPADGTTVATPGTIAVTVNYGGEAVGTFSVTVEEVTIESLSIAESPTKTEYAVGETLDYEGLEVDAYFYDEYGDYTWEDVTANCTFSPAEGTEVTATGIITVTASYGGKTATFAVSSGVISFGDWWALWDTGLLDIYCVGDMPSREWALDCDSVTSVTISSSVTSIGYDAFKDCVNLTSATIPQGVTSIKDSAFENCEGLTSVTIPGSVTSIGDYAFADCDALTSVTIPNSVTSIGKEAFRNCDSVTSVTIPGSVTSIGYGAFSGCTGLTSVVISNGVTSISRRMFEYCANLTSVTIPGSVTSIGDYAFADCDALTNVVIPYGVTSIGDSAFGYCDALTSVIIPASVLSIGVEAFNYCKSLANINVVSANQNFSSENGVLFSKNKRVLRCYPCGNGTTYTIPNSVTSIGEKAFAGCVNLTSVTIPGSVTSIGKWAFYECRGLTSVTIPGSVTSISEGAFSNCRGLTSAVISNGVTSIGVVAFAACYCMTSVTIPVSVRTIGDSAFYTCSSLTDVYYGGSQTQWNAISIHDMNNYYLTGATIHYNSSGPS